MSTLGNKIDNFTKFLRRATQCSWGNHQRMEWENWEEEGICSAGTCGDCGCVIRRGPSQGYQPCHKVDDSFNSVPPKEDSASYPPPPEAPIPPKCKVYDH